MEKQFDLFIQGFDAKVKTIYVNLSKSYILIETLHDNKSSSKTQCQPNQYLKP